MIICEKLSPAILEGDQNQVLLLVTFLTQKTRFLKETSKILRFRGLGEIQAVSSGSDYKLYK